MKAFSSGKNPFFSRQEAYILLFGAVVGFYSFRSTPVWLWLVMGLTGGVLLELKNRKLPRGEARSRLRWADIAALLFTLLLGLVLPDFLGLVKMLFLAIPAGIYVGHVYQRIRNRIKPE